MADYVSAIDAAKLLDLSEKTIRRALKRGLLGKVIDPDGVVLVEAALPIIEPVHKLNERRYSIPIQNVDVYRHHLGKTTLMEVDLRVTRLEEQYKLLKQQFETLLQIVAQHPDQKPDKDRTAAARMNVQHDERRPDSKQEKRDEFAAETGVRPDTSIEAGALDLHTFAALHGIHQRTLRDQINIGIGGDRLPAITREKPNHPGEHEYFFTTAQHRAAITYWRTHHRLQRLHACDFCADLWD